MHIKAHQDKKTKDLPMVAAMNVKVDGLTKQYTFSSDRKPQYTPRIAGDSAQIRIEDRSITKKFKRILREIPTK